MENEYVLELHIVVRSTNVAELEIMEKSISECVIDYRHTETTYEMGGGIRKEGEDGENIG